MIKTTNTKEGAMERESHNGNIRTSELTSPGYVWYRCERYGLNDNTMGKIGYHVCYRPLAGTMYQGNEVVTDEMAQHTREHYAEAETIEAAEHKAQFERDLQEIEESAKRAPSLMARLICKHCGTVCYGDCQA
jgi:rubrerythrin